MKTTDDEGLSPPNLLVIHNDPERGYGTERHYIPYVPQIVKRTDESKQELLIRPPRGLLQLGREKAALRYVEPLLKVDIVISGSRLACSKGAIHMTDCLLHRQQNCQSACGGCKRRPSTAARACGH